MQQRFGKQLHKIIMYLRDEYIPRAKDGHFLSLLKNFASEYFDGNPKTNLPPCTLLPHPGQNMPP
jgi:hypothetical protein